MLVLLRHGQSIWNLENRYTGWVDVDLTRRGEAEAHFAADMLRASGIRIDWVTTSYLKRAIRTMWIVLEDLDVLWLPVEKTWRLNERHYGALQGLNKAESANEFGADRVFQWRRSYDTCPPKLPRNHPQHPRFDPRYARLAEDELPSGESLADTLLRVRPYWDQVIVPRLRSGQNVLLVAHGNSLRALLTYLGQVPIAEVPELVVPTGIPLVFGFDRQAQTTWRHYLGDNERVEQAYAEARRMLPKPIRKNDFEDE